MTNYTMSKYIDAEKLRAEIDAFYTKYKAKFHQNGDSYHLGIIDGLDMAERILDTLEEPEQPTMGYDEAYLNEKIAKASKSWEGVEVDKFMDEVRGREPVSDCHDLEEAAENSWVDYEYREDPRGLYSSCYVDGFKAGAKWQKAKMMEGAVEGTVIELGETYKALSLSVNAKELNQVLQPLGVGDGDNVKIIIVKEGEQ